MLEQLLIIAAGLIAYCNSFTVPFLYDDTLFILDPRTQRYFWPLWKAFIPPAHFQPVIHRPLVTLTLAVNYALGGLDSWGYHAVNLGIHLLAALTLFAVLRRSALSRPLALTVALLWVVHPVNTEAVTFIYQRAEALMALFTLLTLYGVIRCARSPASRRWKLFTVAVCAAGMMGKQGMVAAPLLALAYDRIFLSRSLAETLRLRGKLYLALASTMLIPVFFFAIGHHENRSNFGWGLTALTPEQYALNQPGVILHYLKLAFWPHPLMLDYDRPMMSFRAALLPPLLAAAALLAVTAWALRRRPKLGFLGLAFFLLLSPVCFIPVADPGADHRLYLALAAPLTLAVIAVSRALGERPRIGVVLIACAVGALMIVTLARNHDYRSAVAIWSDNVAKRSGSFRVHGSLGVAYAREGRYAEALEQFKIALQAPKVPPATYSNTGAVLFRLGLYKEGVAFVKTAQEIEPGNPQWPLTLEKIRSQCRTPAKRSAPSSDPAPPGRPAGPPGS